MQKSITRNPKYSISIVHRIIAYVLLISQLLTSCASPNLPLPAPEATGQGLEMELAQWPPQQPINDEQNNDQGAIAHDEQGHDDDALVERPQDGQEEAPQSTNRFCPPSIDCVREKSTALYAGMKSTYKLVEEVFTDMSGDEKPEAISSVVSQNEPAPLEEIQEEEASLEEQGEEAQEEADQLDNEDEAMAATKVATQIKNKIRALMIAVAALSGGFSLLRVQASEGTIASTPDTLSNTWFRYSYPSSYHQQKKQSADFLLEVDKLRNLVDQALEPQNPCNPYSAWEYLPDVSFHQEAQKTLEAHREACRENGKADLSKEFTRVQQQIVNFSSLMKNTFANLTSDWNVPSLPNLTSPTVQNVILSDMYIPQIHEEMPVGNQSDFYRGLIAGRKLTNDVTQDSFNDDGGRDEIYGVHAYCYLYPWAGTLSSAFNDGYGANICSTDKKGYWVLPSQDKKAGDYFDNIDEFLHSMLKYRRVEYTDCLGTVIDKISAEALVFLKVKTKIIDCIRKVLATAYPIRSVKAGLSSDEFPDHGWIDVFSLRKCIQFKGSVSTGVFNWNTGKSFTYIYSYLTGIGPGVGSISPGVITLAPESNSACEDFKARKAQMEKLHNDAIKALEAEQAATNQGLNEYKSKYADLKKKQEALVKQYEGKSKSIADIQKDLDAIILDLTLTQKDVTNRAQSLKDAIAHEKKMQQALERMRDNFKASNAVLSQKIDQCLNLTKESQAEQQFYFLAVDQAFADVRSNLTKIMEKNLAISEAIKNQTNVPIWTASLEKQEREREQFIARQIALKEAYAKDQKERLDLFLNVSINNDERNKKLALLEAKDRQTFDNLTAINEGIMARQMLLDSHRNETQDSLKTIEAEHKRLQNRLVVVNQEIGQIDTAINATQKGLDTMKQKINTKNNQATNCFNDYKKLQLQIEANITGEFNQTIEETIRRRKGLEEEFQKLNQSVNDQKTLGTTEDLERERKKILDQLNALRDNAKQTADNTNKGLDDAKALNDVLWQWNNNFTGMMNDTVNQKMYNTMRWFLDRSAGFDKKMCAYINNPIMNNTAETLCNVNSAFSNYLGSLDNSYLQIPNIVRELYPDFSPKGRHLFKKINTTYAMELTEYQRAYQNMDRAWQEYAIRVANIGRTIYGKPVRTYFESQVNASINKMDEDVNDFISFNEGVITTFLNVMPRLLSVSASVYIIKALAYKTVQDPERQIKASDFLAFGSKMAILPTLALMAYGLKAPVEEYPIGSLKVHRDMFLIAEAACLAFTAVILNLFPLHVHPTIERLVGGVGGLMTIYHFFNLPKLEVTSVMSTCLANLPPQRLATINDQVNAVLAANVLADKRQESYAETFQGILGSIYNQSIEQQFTHCNKVDQENAEQQFKNMILTFMYVYSSINLLSHIVAVVKGYSFKPLTNINITLFAVRCALSTVLAKIATQNIDFKLSLSPVGPLELAIAALVMSMSVKSSKDKIHNQGEQE